MKTRILIFILIFSILMIVLSGVKLNQSYSTEPTIYYDGQKKEISFINIKDTDIFRDFKELMPGDRKEQEILFKADNIKKNTKIFLSLANNVDKEILKFIKIYENDKEITINNEYVNIANLYNDGIIKLKIVVEIPKEIGNEIEEQKGNIEWNILIQEENDELINVPNTYDENNIILYFAIIGICLIVMIYSIIELKNIKK